MNKEKNLLLQATDVSIVFGGLRAVSNFSCELYNGELVGLIGPNGAGKTTVFNMLSGIYHPDNKINNDFFIKHFEEKGVDLTDFLAKLGRNERYIIKNDKENALTMAIEAAKNALIDANISPEQLDAIVYSSDTPEYLCPSNALIINHYLNAFNAHTVYDLNSNCVGMVVALDQISRYMKTSKNYMESILSYTFTSYTRAHYFT